VPENVTVADVPEQIVALEDIVAVGSGITLTVTAPV
jgi:hypothetical protein